MEAPSDTPLPLAHIRVIEMGQLLAGPFCGQLLADFGAEVIKIEDPTSGDPMREWGQEKPHGKSLWWPVISRNKKSVTVNLRTSAGQGVVRELAARSDVLIENFRPGRLEEWDLSYERLAAANPGIVLVRVTGYGQTGPYAGRAGYGAIGEAMGGLRYITGTPEQPPSRTGISIGDALAGTMAAIGALVALQARGINGRGQVVDSAIYEAVLAFSESLVPEFALGGYVRERTGSILPNIAPSNIYPTLDAQWVLIAANQDTVFRRLVRAMEHPELAEDERYATHSERGARQHELDELIADWTSECTAAEILERLERHAVPAGRIFRAPDMLADPHFKARKSIVWVDDDEFGEFPMHNVFPRLSDTPGRVRWTGPQLGQHNDEILCGLLALNDDEIEAATT